MTRLLSATIWTLQAAALGVVFWSLRDTAPGREWAEHPWSYITFTLLCAFFISSELGRAYGRFTRGGPAQRLMLSLLCCALLTWASALAYERIMIASQAEIGVTLGALWIGLLALMVLLGVGFGRREAKPRRHAIA